MKRFAGSTSTWALISLARAFLFSSCLRASAAGVPFLGWTDTLERPLIVANDGNYAIADRISGIHVVVRPGKALKRPFRRRFYDRALPLFRRRQLLPRKPGAVLEKVRSLCRRALPRDPPFDGKA